MYDIDKDLGLPKAMLIRSPTAYVFCSIMQNTITHADMELQHCLQ